MTFTVHRSQFADQSVFEQAVTSHIARMYAFNKEVGKPRPVAHPLVEASIKRIQKHGQPDQYVPDYTLVDDTLEAALAQSAPPPPTLEEKRQAAHTRLINAENAAKHKILGLRKMRLVMVKNNIAAAKKEADRTAEDNENMATFQDFQKKFIAIELMSAAAEATIDDVPEAELANWQPPVFV